MSTVEKVDVRNLVLDIHRDLSVSARERQPGPPVRIDGMSVGIVTILPGHSPHKGEMHPDGDEILYVVSGTLQLKYDSGEHPLILSAGEACIVRRGEWHMVDCLEETTLMHITPGPNGEARFD
ncbi:MAG: cupin domain-containing protein [Alphaproteobacteria bacterium]